jgi:NAD(P)-dependent dehydrogenase (short-subunit alcohol dehydrogenase family)
MQPLETMMRLANKTALITGGNSGIGLATARLFVAEGARVAITGRNQATLEAAARELGPNALAIVADASDVAATEGAVARAVEKFGKLDIVFANAGISDNTPVGGTTLAAFENVIRTNITAVFFTVQAAAPHLNDGASIILNGSVISVLGNPGYSAYAASKAGVRAGAARRSRRSCQDRVVPCFRRFVERSRRGNLRRRRRDRLPGRRADLSRIRRTWKNHESVQHHTTVSGVAGVPLGSIAR